MRGRRRGPRRWSLPELAGKTYFQVERLAWRAALAVAPEVAERRRSRAERERARVTVFREESGAVGLSGRDLPAAQALAGHASVVARARLYEASGAFPGQGTSGLEALAYLHLLNGVSAGDAIAFARAAAAEPPDGGSDEGGPDDGGPDDGGPDDGGPDDSGPDDGDPEGGAPEGGGHDRTPATRARAARPAAGATATMRTLARPRVTATTARGEAAAWAQAETHGGCPR